MMKSAVVSITLACAAALAVAQSASAPAKAANAGAPAKTASSKAPAKASAAKRDNAKTAKAKTPPRKKTEAVALPAAVPTPAAEAVLGAAELEIAERVHVGSLPCELGNTVHLTQDAARPGHFDLQIAKNRYRLVPVPTSTGAIRLEDAKAGAVWLQLANKSMLMNHKLGQRMADECKSPAQVAVAEQFKLQPPPSVLEPAQSGAQAAAAP